MPDLDEREDNPEEYETMAEALKAAVAIIEGAGYSDLKLVFHVQATRQDGEKRRAMIGTEMAMDELFSLILDNAARLGESLGFPIQIHFLDENSIGGDG